MVSLPDTVKAHCKPSSDTSVQGQSPSVQTICALVAETPKVPYRVLQGTYESQAEPPLGRNPSDAGTAPTLPLIPAAVLGCLEACLAQCHHQAEESNLADMRKMSPRVTQG